VDLARITTSLPDPVQLTPLSVNQRIDMRQHRYQNLDSLAFPARILCGPNSTWMRGHQCRSLEQVWRYTHADISEGNLAVDVAGVRWN
jgi:hypothetical protein